MAFDRAQRYASVEELQRDLTAYQAGFATRAEKAEGMEAEPLLRQAPQSHRHRHRGAVLLVRR